LRRLVGYWAAGYDWRAHEATINALPSRFADLDGMLVHYLRFDAERDAARPIVLTNGWPSMFYELTELARRLSAPSQYGGNPQDAFTVIVPSIPGLTFSPQPASLEQALPTHELWHRLMHDGTELSTEERTYLNAWAAWSQKEGAFAAQQRTRPLTLAPG
jgi:hypothetical protein